jgi:hypothetical protein
LRRLERDPEKWEPVFPRDKRESVYAEITLKQSDEIMMRFSSNIALLGLNMRDGFKMKDWLRR